MTALRAPLLTALGMTLLTACATPPEAPATARSTLVLEEFFPGRTTGEGVFVNAWSGARRPFEVTIDGTWDGRTLTLVEDFVFADGERDRKTWTFVRTAPGVYSGTREDVVGTARAWTDGKVVRLEYTVKLGGWNVDFSDVLALESPETVLNTATVGKWMLRVGRVELRLRRAPAS